MQKSSLKNIDTPTGNKRSYTGCAGKPPSPSLITKTKTSIDTDYLRPTLGIKLSDKILCSMTEAFILTDHYGLIKETNTQLLDLLDYTEVELKDRPLNLIMEKDSDCLDIGSNATSEQKHSLNATLRTRSNVLIPVDLSITPYTDETTGARYTIILTKDLRDKNHLTKELKKTKKELMKKKCKVCLMSFRLMM